jgi:hypothetical protein
MATLGDYSPGIKWLHLETTHLVSNGYTWRLLTWYQMATLGDYSPGIKWLHLETTHLVSNGYPWRLLTWYQMATLGDYSPGIKWLHLETTHLPFLLVSFWYRPNQLMPFTFEEGWVGGSVEDVRVEGGMSECTLPHAFHLR